VIHDNAITDSVLGSKQKGQSVTYCMSHADLESKRSKRLREIEIKTNKIQQLKKVKEKNKKSKKVISQNGTQKITN